MARVIETGRQQRGPGTGRGRPVNEIGRVYGRWTVVERAPSPVLHRKDPSAFWRCACVCGNEGVVRGHQLRCGQSQSCGCFRKDRARETVSLPKGKSGANRAIANTKSNAARRGYCWKITDDQALATMAMDCVYCGSKPSQVSRGRNGDFTYSGIDRIDNARGYEVDNIAPCCRVCNTAKMSMSEAEFYSWIERVYRRAAALGRI